jgi:hypothetical protein
LQLVQLHRAPRSQLAHFPLVVLRRHMTQSQAVSTLKKLRAVYPDWNELRVSQVQEIASLMVAGKLHAPVEDIQKHLPVVRDARDYLQEIYQKTHGFDLEFLKDDSSALKLITQMPFLGTAGASWLLWLATGKQVPVHGAMVRALDRLGIVTRGAGSKKQKELRSVSLLERSTMMSHSSWNTSRKIMHVSSICSHTVQKEGKIPIGRLTMSLMMKDGLRSAAHS